MPPKDPIKNSPAPKIGDVRNVVDGTTTYYTKNNINLPVTDPQKKANTPVITPESLQSANAPVVTPVPPATQAPKLMADIEAQQEDLFNQKLAADKEAASQSKGTALEAYLEQVRGAKGLSTLTAEAYATPDGVNAITPELNDINDQIRREQLALRRATEGVTKAGGQSKAQAQAQINNLTRESLAKQADLAVIQQMVQGRYDSAKEIADRAVDAQLEQQKQAIDIAKFDYEENKDLFTKTEQREYDSLFADRQRRLEEIKQNKQDMYDLGLQASADGAPQSVVEKMFQAKTREEALAIGGSYIGRLDRMQAEANLANTYSQITDRKERLQLAKDAALLDDKTAAAAGLAENEVAAEKALGMFSMLNELATHPGFGTAVGPNPFARGLSPQGTLSAFITGDRSEFRSLADQIANTLTLDNMDKLKGPATDKDVELVANSVSKLKNYDLSQEAYMREITRISEAMKRIAIQKGVTADQLQFYGIANEAAISEFDQMWGSPQSTSSVIMSSTF